MAREYEYEIAKVEMYEGKKLVFHGGQKIIAVLSSEPSGKGRGVLDLVVLLELPE